MPQFMITPNPKEPGEWIIQGQTQLGEAPLSRMAVGMICLHLAHGLLKAEQTKMEMEQGDASPSKVIPIHGNVKLPPQNGKRF